MSSSPHTQNTLEALVRHMEEMAGELAARLRAMRDRNVDDITVSYGTAEMQRAVRGTRAFVSSVDKAILDARIARGDFGEPNASQDPARLKKIRDKKRKTAKKKPARESAPATKKPRDMRLNEE